MKNLFRFSIPLLVLAATACTLQRDIEADKLAVRQLQEDAVRAFNAGDLLGLLTVYTEGAMLIPPDSAGVWGQRPIEERYRELFRDFACQLSQSSDEIVVSGDLAFVRGTYSLDMTPQAGGEPVSQQGMYLNIYHRRPDGIWGLARQSWSSYKPLEEPAAPKAASKSAAKSQPPVVRRLRPARFAVQLGAFGKRSDAEALAQKISNLYKLDVVVAPANVDGRAVYRVRILAASKEEAETLAARIGAEQKLKTWVVSRP